MKDFKNWGVKRRIYKEKNYNAIWSNLETIRLGDGTASELPPDRAEFYDVALNTKCNIRCPFCYTDAREGGENFKNICKTWRDWMSTFPNDIVDETGIIYTEKPFQIAISSMGEGTIHPDFPQFLETVFETGVVPNYTTNGIILAEDTKRSQEIMEYTKNYCGAVAVSLGNKEVRPKANKAIEKLFKEGEVKVAIHHIISDKDSVDELIKVALEYGSDINYHVLLPLMKHGRSTTEMRGDSVFEYLEESLIKEGIKNVAFGANFSPYLNKTRLRLWNYPQETFGKNVILREGKIVITPSSFNLKPCLILNVN